MSTLVKKIRLTASEWQRLSANAKGESESNLIRRRLGLSPLKHGAKEGNKNAVKKR
jgi:hypothetical protein